MITQQGVNKGLRVVGARGAGRSWTQAQVREAHAAAKAIPGRTTTNREVAEAMGLSEGGMSSHLSGPVKSAEHYGGHPRGKRGPYKVRGQQPTDVGKREVSKRTYDDQVVDPVRVAGAGMGGAAAVWGAPRIAMIGRALDRGTKSSAAGTAARAKESRGLVRGLENLSEPVGRATSAFFGASAEGRAVQRVVPKGLRPALAVAGGGYVVSRSTPVKRTRHREIVP